METAPVVSTTKNMNSIYLNGFWQYMVCHTFNNDVLCDSGKSVVRSAGITTGIFKPYTRVSDELLGYRDWYETL
jgi:hypothetical protein